MEIRLDKIPRIRRIFATIEDRLIRSQLESVIHAVENETTGIIFVKPPLEIFSCSKPATQALQLFLDGAARSRACNTSGVAPADFDALLHFLLTRSESPVKPEEETTTERVLERLVMNVTQTCNLRCRYCYAGGGNYNLPNSVMSKETALKTLDRFYEIYDDIKQLQFFGGEPLLNPELIDLVCDEIKRRHTKGIISSVPNFGVVTNGTIASDECLHILEKHGINCTVSLDGPRSINDYLRGKHTYDRVVHFLDTLDKRGMQYGFEATFTAYHLEKGMDLAALLDFFVTTFDKHEMHIPQVGLPPGHPLALTEQQALETYRAGVEYSIRNLRDGTSPWLSFATRIMNVFLERRPTKFTCPAGLGTISIDTEGNAYPCFMFTGVDRFRFGNVYDDVFPDPKRADRIFTEIIENDKSQNPRCGKCWASPFCFGCIGMEYMNGGGNLEKTDCDLMKAMVEGFLCAGIEFLDEIRKPGDRLHNVEERALPDF